MYLLDAMQDAEKWYQLQTKVAHCGVDKIKLLWEIFVETDLCDTQTLKNKIYEYGSCLKENDYLGRELFVIMTAFVK